MKPSTSSELVENPAPATRSDAPKGKLVMVAGPASKGPTEPVTIEEPEDAYRLWGNEGPLADTVAAVLQGAALGTEISQDNRYGQVRVLRTETGTTASADLFDVDGKEVMTIETASSGRDANEYYVEENGDEYLVYDPEAPESERFKSFITDPGNETEGAIGTPTELADAIREAFGGRLHVTSERYSAHFEFSTYNLTDGDEEVAITSSESETSLDFSDTTITDMNAIQWDATTIIGGDENYFDDTTNAAAAHDRILSQENPDARFYAVTGGKPTVLPEGAQQARINRLGDISQISAPTNSLLNIRTTGEGAGSDIQLSEAGSDPNSDVVSEAYYRVRRDNVDQLDVSDTQPATSDLATHDVAAAENTDPSGDIGSSNSSSTLSYDGYSVSAGEYVLIFGQDADTDGLYEVADDSGNLYLKETRYRTAETVSSEVLDILNGSSNSGVKQYNVTSLSIADAEAIQITFDAPAGIATDYNDGDGSTSDNLVDSYQSYVGSNYSAAELSTGRLEADEFDFSGFLKLEMAPLVDDTAVEQIPLSFEQGSDLQAHISWSDGEATLELSKSDFQDEYGTQYNDGYVFVSYDSCIAFLNERSSEPQLNKNADQLQYSVDDFDLTLNQELPHDLVVRPLMVTQYRLGNEITVERTGDGSNEFVISGDGKQPGEGGGAVGNLETVIGFEYDFEPDFPTIGDQKGLSGGTSGLNADAATKAQALKESLEEYIEEEYSAIVPAGLYVDDTKTSTDQVTGARSTKPVDTLSILSEHQDQLDARGASGLVFMDVQQMERSTASRRFSLSQKRERFRELVSTGGSGETTTASIIQEESRPEFFFFDAPMVVSLNNKNKVIGGAAFFAGLRSTIQNDRALYQVDIPKTRVQPLYKYDDAQTDMTNALSNNRINAWNTDRNVVRLSSEVTGAGMVPDSSGELVPSSYISGISVIISKEFQRQAESELENLIGPMNASGPEQLRNVIKTQLDGVGNRIRGVLDVDLDPQKDVQIDSDGGSSVGVRIRCDIRIPGELLSISLAVGSYTQFSARSGNDQSDTIPSSR